MRTKSIHILILLVLILFLVAGCASMVEPEAKTDTGEAMQLPPYSGKKAKVAVADFEWKVDQEGSTTTISGMGGQSFSISHSENNSKMTGLRDMLTTTMVQSNRYRVLERQNIGSLQQEMALTQSGYTDSSGIQKGGIKGADLLVMGAITGWEPGTSGTGGGVGTGWVKDVTAIFGAAGGSVKKSSMAMDIRIVDTNTSEVLAATRVEGEAKEVDFTGVLGAIGGSGGMGGGLSSYAKTPMEDAIRMCMYNAVKFIAENTPSEYMKY